MGHWCNWMKWSAWKGLIHCGCWVNIAEWNLNLQIITHIPECISFGFPYVATWAPQVASVVKNPPANAGDLREVSSNSGSGGAPGWAWQATVHRVSKSWTQLKDLAWPHASQLLANLKLLKGAEDEDDSVWQGINAYIVGLLALNINTVCGTLND